MNRNKFFKKQKNKNNSLFFIYGLHSVRAALANKARKKHRLLATTNALMKFENNEEIKNIRIEKINVQYLDKLLGKDVVHQGVALEVEPLESLELSAISGAKLVLLLDQITDPHNVGAIMRSASAFGADAIISPARFSSNETGVLAKSASGALDIVPFIRVNNLAKTIEILKNDGLNIIGLDSAAEAVLTPNMKFDRIGLVLGAEGKGLRQRTRKLCDKIVRLDMKGKIKSLNVSNAAAIALYALTIE